MNIVDNFLNEQSVEEHDTDNTNTTPYNEWLIEACGKSHSKKKSKKKKKKKQMKENDGSAYRKFFTAMMKKKGINSPDELSKEEKKKFFNKIDWMWKSKKEMNETTTAKQFQKGVKPLDAIKHGDLEKKPVSENVIDRFLSEQKTYPKGQKY